ncbi:MAG TPA: type II secretion system protein [Chlamydiales bacterium]|nr:type II secretion system protein [Chlamydiales bacterium]
MKKSKRLFTLLEVMIAMVVLVIASGGIAWKMQGAVRRKQFQSELERFRARLMVCQRLAVAMQADWRGVLVQNGQEWTFEVTCEEEGQRRLSSLVLHSSIQLDGKKISGMTLDFFASGQVLPAGRLTFSQNGERVEWRLSEIFQKDEGKRLGPVHPSEG